MIRLEYLFRLFSAVVAFVVLAFYFIFIKFETDARP